MPPWMSSCNNHFVKAGKYMWCHKQGHYYVGSDWKPQRFPINLTYLRLQEVYLWGIILQNLSCTCWTHTNITGSRLARVLHFLLLSCDYSRRRLSRALGQRYSSSRKWKQRGYNPSKQVNHVKFLKLPREIRPRELQLFWPIVYFAIPKKRYQKVNSSDIWGDFLTPWALWILRHDCSHDQRSQAALRGDGTRSSHPHFVWGETIWA